MCYCVDMLDRQLATTKVIDVSRRQHRTRIGDTGEVVVLNVAVASN